MGVVTAPVQKFLKAWLDNFIYDRSIQIQETLLLRNPKRLAEPFRLANISPVSNKFQFLQQIGLVNGCEAPPGRTKQYSMQVWAYVDARHVHIIVILAIIPKT